MAIAVVVHLMFLEAVAVIAAIALSLLIVDGAIPCVAAPHAACGMAPVAKRWVASQQQPRDSHCVLLKMRPHEWRSVTGTLHWPPGPGGGA